MKQLGQFLNLRRGDVVSFVGGGGKTTAMFRLAHELVDQGWRVITTTTTQIAPPEPKPDEQLILATQESQALREIELAWQQARLVTLATELLPGQPKLRGIPPSWIQPLSHMADAVLVEADGARMKPFKAPAGHEPVVPECTSVLIPTVGIDIVGRPLSAETTHRPERVSELTGLQMGATITPHVVTQVLTHPLGGLKGLPATARVIPLINKVETATQLQAAREAASALLRHPRVQRVLIAALAENGVAECWRNVSVVVLAAGGSRRMGTCKQLLPVAGLPMIKRVLQAISSVPIHEAIVVLGGDAADIAPHIPAQYQVVLNPDWQSGLSSSVRVGLAKVSSRSEAALFVLADQPLLDTSTLETILYAYFGTQLGIVVPHFGGRRGNPVLFDRRLFAQLDGVRGDSGGREVIRSVPEQVLSVEVSTPESLVDIDTQEDYRRLVKSLDGF